jgi:hypothetical protein
VVHDTESLRSGRGSSTRWTIVPLPAPEGPEIMNSRARLILDRLPANGRQRTGGSDLA